MKLMINTAHQRFGGAVQVALSFISECRKYSQHQYIVLVGPGLKDSIDPKDYPENFEFEWFDFGTIGLRKSVTINKLLRNLELRYLPDVVISTTGPSYFHSRAPQVLGFNLPYYIYPESPYIQDLSFTRKIKLWSKKILHYHFFKRDGTVFLAQTEDVNQRMRKALGVEKVYTVSNTASRYYRMDYELSPKLPPRENERFRFVTISAYYGHKNLELIPQILEVLRSRGVSNVDFIMTIKPEDYERAFPKMDGLINVGPVKPSECPSLYQECDALFLPTLAECFSASYPEAMIMEKPIITTNLGFARTLCGPAALYFEPKNAESAADEIQKLLDHPEIQEELIKNGTDQLKLFDLPEDRAKKYLEICERISKEEPRRR